MPISVSCSCGARLNAPDTAAGKNVKCPKCKATLAVPAQAADFEVVEDDPPPQPKKKPVVAVADDEDEAKPRKKSREEEPQPAKKKRPARQDDEDEDEDDRPRKKRKAVAEGGSSKVLIAAIGGVLLLAVGGFAVYWFAIREKPAETAGNTKGTTDEGGAPPSNPKLVQGKTVTANWRQFTSARFAFKTSFPWGDPTEAPFLGRLPGGVAPNDAATFSALQWAGDKPSYAFRVTTARFRPGLDSAAREKAGDDFLQEFSVPKGMKRSEPNPVTWAGRPAREYVTEPEAPPDGDKVERITARLLVTEAGVYFASVRDVGGLAPAEIARFFDGFEFTTPKQPDAKQPDPKQPPPASLPPLPPGWVAFNDFAKRYEGQIPPGGQVTASSGKLAYLKDVGKGKITDGQYNEVVYPDKGAAVSMRVLVFARDTTPAERVALLDDYAKRLAAAADYAPNPSRVKWGNLDAMEETVYAPDYSHARRYAVTGTCGFVMTLRGTKRAEFDEWKGLLFDHVLPRGCTPVGVGVPQKGWEELSSDAGLFRVEIPGTPAPAEDLNKILADLKMTGEFQRVTAGTGEYAAGYVKFSGKQGAADRKRVQDALVAVLKPPGAPDKKPLILPGKPPRQLPWEEYQWQIKGGQLSGQIRFHESDGILRVLAYRSPDDAASQDRVRFFQFFDLLR